MDFDEEVDLDDLIELSYAAEDQDGPDGLPNRHDSIEPAACNNTSEDSGKKADELQNDELDLDSLTEWSCDIDDPSTVLGAAPTVKSDQDKGTVKEDSKNLSSSSEIIRKKPRVLVDIPLDSLLNKASESNSTDKDVDKTSSTLLKGDLDSSDDELDEENKLNLTEAGKMIKKRIDVLKSYEKPQRHVIKTWKDKETPPEQPGVANKNMKKQSYMVEEFSGLRIINPLVSRDFLKERMLGRRLVKMSNIRSCMKNGDIEGDWVTIGVLVNKLPPKTSKNGKTYSIWKMCDRLDAENHTSVFFFGKAHTDHWKTAIGTVLGILNPSILPDQEGNRSCVSISVDHPGKVLLFGTSKDFGTCKGQLKKGGSCTAVVDKSKCEYCSYHISKEYRKFSLKRAEFQGASRLGNGRQADFKSRILKGQNFMYGGQMFSTPAGSASQQNSKKAKDRFTLSNLNPLKRKADILDEEERNKRPAALTAGDSNKRLSESKFIDEKLSQPSPGSRNLFQHLVNTEKAKKVENKAVVSVTPKELLKLHEEQMKAKRAERNSLKHIRSNSLPSENLTPKIGLGCKPGDEICFEMRPNLKKHLSTFTSELAKVKAIQKIKEKGPLRPKDPNAVKNTSSPELQLKVKHVLEKSVENSLKKSIDNQVEVKEPLKKVAGGMLSCIDISSEKMKKLLEKKSNHFYEVEMADAENNEAYFNALEKKEQMEEKMMATKEIVCSVVSCKICDYTAHCATERCKNEQHPLRTHKAVKRFFSCTDCKRRTFCFTKLPKRACRNCGGSSFEKTGMMKPRSGPKLDSEILHIRGEERKFINS